MQSTNRSKNSTRTFACLSISLVLGATLLAVIPQAHAVSNVAGTSFVTFNNTKNPADGNVDCTSDQCILMSSDGVAGNDNHGIFSKVTPTGGDCASPSLGVNGGEYVSLTTAMASTAISTLSFIKIGTSPLCQTPNTWQIFKTTKITPNTIWAIKLDSSANFPATLNSSNLIQCNPTGNFNTTTGCDPIPPPVSASINLNFSKQVETFTTEIELK